MGSYQKADGLLHHCSAYLEVNVALECVPTPAAVCMLECAYFLPFTPQHLKTCFWMFRACWVWLGESMGGVSSPLRVISEGWKSRNKVGKMLVLHCWKTSMLQAAPHQAGCQWVRNLCHLSLGKREPGCALKMAGLGGWCTVLLAGTWPFHRPWGSTLTTVHIAQE